VTETLFIRLGSQAHDTIHWLVLGSASTDEPEVIASGELNGAAQLGELTSKAAQREVKVLVPGSDVLLKSLCIPAKSSRAIRQATPYMLEDILAEEVEQLFFAYANLNDDIQGNNCFTAIVSHSQMRNWLSWLADAEIETLFILPDVLAMPLMEQGWSAVAIGDGREEQVILRQHHWQGTVLDIGTWKLQWKAFTSNPLQEDSEDDEHPKAIRIEAYSPLVYSEELDVVSMPEELPLALMAKNYGKKLSHFNLLQGQYKIKESRSHAGQQWLWVAGVAMFALLLSLGHKSVQLWQLKTEQEVVKESIIADYKKAFPKTKRVRVSTIKSQLNRELALLGGASDRQGFLAMLAKVQPAFAKVSGLKPESLKFDGKRQELRIQAQAKDYQAFEQFSIALTAANLTVKQGSQSNQGDQVSGSFSITNKVTSKKKGSTRKRSNSKNKEAS
jgi:general secretion pathway protein L